MFFFLSKTLFYFLMPISWIALFLLIALFSKKWRFKSLKAGIILFLLFTNPFLANEMYLLWEVAPTPIKEVQNYQIGIVLTGMSNSGKEPKDRIYASQGIDRLLQAVRLYKEGKIKKIAIVGMTEEIDLLTGQEKLPKRSYTYKNMLKDMCIKEEDILIEPKSKNTYENAQFSATFLQNNKAQLSIETNSTQNQILVITSAFHLRRSLGCFQKAGLKVDGFSTDFIATERKNMFTILSLIPTEDAMAKWGKIIHEMVGYVVYDATGKL